MDIPIDAARFCARYLVHLHDKTLGDTIVHVVTTDDVYECRAIRDIPLSLALVEQVNAADLERIALYHGYLAWQEFQEEAMLEQTDECDYEGWDQDLPTSRKFNCPSCNGLAIQQTQEVIVAGTLMVNTVAECAQCGYFDEMILPLC